MFVPFWEDLVSPVFRIRIHSDPLLLDDPDLLEFLTDPDPSSFFSGCMLSDWYYKVFSTPIVDLNGLAVNILVSNVGSKLKVKFNNRQKMSRIWIHNVRTRIRRSGSKKKILRIRNTSFHRDIGYSSWMTLFQFGWRLAPTGGGPLWCSTPRRWMMIISILLVHGDKTKYDLLFSNKLTIFDATFQRVNFFSHWPA